MYTVQSEMKNVFSFSFRSPFLIKFNILLALGHKPYIGLKFLELLI